MTSVRITRFAAAILLAAVAALAAVDRRSESASRVRAGRPLTALLSLDQAGREGSLAPALYLLVLGPKTGSADLIRIPPQTPVFERAPDGGRDNLRTLADVYGDAYAPQKRLDRAQSGFAEAALTMLQANPAWPETGAPAGADGGMPAPLDILASVYLSSDSLPGYPLEMLRLLRSSLKDPLFWPRLPLRTRSLGQAPRAERSPYDLFILAREFRRLDPRKVRVSELADPELTPRLLAGVFARARENAEPKKSSEAEILNASDSDGLALKATKILRLRGFDVVHFGNAPASERSTIFVDKTGSAENAFSAAAALGCPDPAVLTALEEQPRAAVSVVLGRDFKSCAELAQDRSDP